MTVRWLELVSMRAGNFLEGMRIAGIEKWQAAILKRLNAFHQEHSDYGSAESYMDGKQRSAVREMWASVIVYDRQLSEYERYLSGKTTGMGKPPAWMETRLKDMKETNSRLRMLIDEVRADGFKLLDRIVDGELKEEADIAEKIGKEGPKAASAELGSLKKELDRDSRAMSALGKKNSAIYSKLSEREKNLPALQQRYKTMLNYLNRIHRYYANEVQLKNRIKELEWQGAALDGNESRIMVEAGDMSMVTAQKKMAILMALKALQAKRLAYVSDVIEANRQINEMIRTFSEFRRWYSDLEAKPNEIMKAYQDAEKLYNELHTKTIERNDRGLSSVTQLIQRFEGVPIIGT